MSFLTPLYALAALAVALPILFHLVRRQPKDRKWISSLMFLDPAPPRLTRQSRIDHWLLLLLRIAALGLLAFAFTRPYWNMPAATDSDGVGMQRMLLIDTSASMRREGVWAAAMQRAEQRIHQMGPTDSLSVYEFDKNLRPLLAIDESQQIGPAQRALQASTALGRAKPTWNKTNLGFALSAAADLLQTDWNSASDSNATPSEIIVVTDFQNGASVDRLAEYAWPESCKVRIERVEPPNPGNAHASLLAADEDLTAQTEGRTKGKTEGSTKKIRVRVSNIGTTSADALSLRWLDDKLAPIEETKLVCRIPSGSSMTVRMVAPPSNASALQIDGDRVDFDNRLFVATNKPTETSLLCIEKAATLPEDSLGFFLKQLPLSDAATHVTFRSVEPGQISDKLDVNALIVASHDADANDLIALGNYVKNGGNLLWVWDAPVAPSDTRLARDFEQLTGGEQMMVTEASLRQYAMLESIDFKHPLFADLADSKFNDFSKIRFWKHRKLDGSAIANWRVLAKFDDGAPALITKQLGSGSVWILLSGWQPRESQLALSTKFVPLIAGLFRLASPPRSPSGTYHVGDKLSLDVGESIFDPAGKLLDSIESPGVMETPVRQIELTEPGIYRRLDQDGLESRMAVNLDESESNTRSGGLERLERMGVAMAGEPVANKQAKEDKRRQLRAVELESQQGWWRWVVVGVLGVVGLESLMCIRRAT